MPPVRDSLKRARSALATSMQSPDWSMIALIAGFVLISTVAAVFGKAVALPALWLSRLFLADSFADYEAALAAYALKRPEYQQRLKTIDPGSTTVNVVTFRARRELPLRDRNFEIWVALGGEVREACAGAADPARALQQILGLPPVAAPNNVVTELEVPRDGLFRPCLGRSDLGTAVCEFDLSDPPAADADAATLKAAYEH